MVGLLIENGRLVDPSQNIDRVARVLVTAGVIAAIDPSDGDVADDCQRIDASGKIVAPGLVDLGRNFASRVTRKMRRSKRAATPPWLADLPRCCAPPAPRQ